MGFDMDGIRFSLHKIVSKLPVVTYDALCIPVAWYISYWFRYTMQPFPNDAVWSYSLKAFKESY